MAAKFDIKALAVQHGEKAVLGIVLLLVVWFLVSARWSTYERRPSEFSDKVAQGNSTLLANNWGAEQDELHALADEELPINVVTAALDQDYDVSDFQLSRRFTVQLNDGKEPLRMLEAADIQQLIASSFVAYLEFPVEEDAESETEDADDPMPEETEPSEFELLIAESTSSSAAPGAPGGMSGSSSNFYADYEAQSSMYAEESAAMSEMMSGMYGPGSGGPRFRWHRSVWLWHGRSHAGRPQSQRSTLSVCRSTSGFQCSRTDPQDSGSYESRASAGSSAVPSDGL